nr:MerR family transcriptional regulator [Ktedonobacter robiniae]
MHYTSWRYSISDVAKHVRVSVKTLQHWDGEGKRLVKRTASGRRYSSEADLAATCMDGVLIAKRERKH